MNIKASDLRANRDTGQGSAYHLDLKRRIYAAWKAYNEGDDTKLVNEAYEEWGRLSALLYEIEFAE